MSINFNIRDRNKKVIFNYLEVLNLCGHLEKYSQKNKLDFFLLYGADNSSSLFLITSLYLSKCNFAVSPESFDKEKLNIIFKSKRTKIIDQKFLEEVLNNNILKYKKKSIFDSEKEWNDRLINSFKNFDRVIGYFSSGSTGEPKLIPVSSHMSYLCHQKVLDNFKNINGIKNIICFHDNSFVISLNYISLSLMMDISLLCIYDKNPLSFLFYLKKSCSDSLLISIPSFWEKVVSFLIKNKLKIHSIISCGEPLKWDCANNLYESSIHNCFNYYGATEFSTWVFYFPINNFAIKNREKDEAYVPIGYPLKGIESVITNQGELGIKCSHMIRNYIFRDYSFFKADIRIFEDDKEFLFTGDRACIKNNKFYCLGRKDGLLKVKGIFIDLYVIQEKLALFLEMRKFVLIISNKQVVSLYVDSKGVNEKEKLSIRTKVEKILEDNLNSKILRNITMEDNGLKYNRSLKLDRSYYFLLSSGKI